MEGLLVPKPVVPLSISAPGFYGLNKQKEGGILEPGWATEALNCVIDEAGRITSRKGYIHDTLPEAAFTGTTRTIFGHISPNGAETTVFTANNKIFVKTGTLVTESTITGITITDDNWQLVNFNGFAYGLQSGHSFIESTTIGGPLLEFHVASLTGTQQPTTSANAITSAFGRLWIMDGSDLKYSDLLDGTAWNGVFDLSKYWFSGADEGIAVEEFNGFLVVFGKNNIIIFNNPYDPAGTMQIVENIGGVGCIARDSIQNIGTDILFLSHTGVRSLGRTIQEKSMPVNDVTRNVRDYMMSYVVSENKDYIKSVYSPLDGFYLLSLPTQGKSFCIDIRTPLPDGSARVTEWDLAPTAIGRTKESIIYLDSPSDSGKYISKYSGYVDAADLTTRLGVTYTMSWNSGWVDFGEEARPYLKIAKKITLLMGGMAGSNVTIKWAYDYESNFSTNSISFPGGLSAKYGIAQYGIGLYSSSLTFNTGRSSLNSAGQVMKFGVSATVDGNKVILQRIDLITKIGRIAI